MSCQKWQEMIIDRIADELSESDAIIVEQHLADCAVCRAEFSHLKGLIATAGRREEWPFDLEMESRLATQLRQRPSQKIVVNRSQTGDETGPFRLAATLVRLLFLRPVPSVALVTVLFCAIACGFWWGRSVEPVNPGAGLGEERLMTAAIFDSSFIAGAIDLSSQGSAVARDSIATVRTGLQRPFEFELAFFDAQSDAIRGGD